MAFETACYKCGKEAVYKRRVSGENLCRKCFLKSFSEKIVKTISRYKMFERNDSIAVAFSGGRDSATLLHVLVKIEKKFPESEIIALFIDEGIEKYRQNCHEIVEENCKKLGVELVTSSLKELFGITIDEIINQRENLIATTPKKHLTVYSACAYCGILRRKAINLVAREKIQADKIALAHNLDDEAQTILLNILRADIERIAREYRHTARTNPLLVPRVKPFRETPGREIALYAYYKKINYHYTECPYAQEAMREDLKKYLAEMEQKRPGTLYNIIRSGETIAKALQKYPKTTKTLTTCQKCGEPSAKKTCKACETIQQYTAANTQKQQQQIQTEIKLPKREET
ncbi:MAG: TIGR00269 family protein [Candidatus Wukongarchaeota archaeon]|nr:TIGR00269 family protein [Candidatus Wukongarchaeota archaeon]